MIDWWALRFMPPSAFLELASACGLRLLASDLERLDARGLVPALRSQGDVLYSLVHLLPLWAYGEVVTTWRHPWADGGLTDPEGRALDELRDRFRPLRQWLEGRALADAVWEQLASDVKRRHPLGRARQMGLLLDPSVLDSVTGEVRLFLELDRFFAAWAGLREQRRREGLSELSASELAVRPELTTASGPYPAVLRLPDEDAPGESGRSGRFGLDEEVLRTGEFAAMTDSGSQVAQVLSPGEAAREHARRAAEETSALIPLAVAAKRSNMAERLSAFAARERELFDVEAWGDLAEHYRASLDLFTDDVEVGRLLKKLALVHLDRLGRVEDGTDFYLRALERLPTDQAGLHTVDHLLATQERWEELAAIWQRTATVAEGALSSAAWLRVASILLSRLHNMPEAIQAVRFALEEDPNNAEARTALSNLASLSPEERSGARSLEATRGEWARLAAIAERWARRLGNDQEAADWYERAAELYLSGRDGADAAFACLEAALERDPERLSALSRLEALARHLERWETFEAIVERFIERQSELGQELRLSLVAETFRERLKDGGVPEPIYRGLLERLPPVTGAREPARPAAPTSAGQYTELARRLIREASEPEEETPSAAVLAGPRAAKRPTEDPPGGGDPPEDAEPPAGAGRERDGPEHA
jgi:tetratricopeptide (TPR) repeat protein